MDEAEQERGDRIVRDGADGFVTPAIARNGSRYSLIGVSVYQDGLIAATSNVDLANFRKQIAAGTIRPSIPDGRTLYVPDLGAWQVEGSHWVHAQDTLYQHVVDRVRQLNPTLEHLLDTETVRSGRTFGDIRYADVVVKNERPVGPKDPITGERPRGYATPVLVADQDRFSLADLRVFPTGLVQLGRLPEPMALHVADLPDRFADGRLCTSVPHGTRIHIAGLGSFGAIGKAIDADDKLREIQDWFEMSRGRPTTISRCRDAYEQFRDDPSDTRRDTLRAAYEAVPTHMRCFVGDQDTQDFAVRKAIYDEDWKPPQHTEGKLRRFLRDLSVRLFDDLDSR